MLHSKGKWQARIAEHEREEIAKQLAQIESVTGPAGRRTYLNRKITELAASHDHRSQLHRFIYLMHLLTDHSESPFLKPSEVNDAITLVRSILKVAGVDSSNSRLSYLHAELNQIVSKIYMKQHDVWTSVWTQHTALSSLTGASDIIAGKHHVATGNRVLRLGHTALALGYFREALEKPLSERQLAITRVGIIRSNRLSGNFAIARLLLQEFKLDYDKASTPFQYLMWEEACLDVSELQSFEKMLAAVKSGSSHHTARYVLEASFWARTMMTRDVSCRLAKASSIAKRFDLEGSECLWKIADALESCLDTGIDLMIRTNLIGRRLGSANKLLSMNHEMLVYLSAARTLARVGAFHFASICLAEYVARSLRTSNGLDEDVLKLGSDLIQRPWFKRVADDKAMNLRETGTVCAAGVEFRFSASG